MAASCTHLDQIKITRTKVHVCRRLRQDRRYLGTSATLHGMRPCGLLRFIQE